MGEPIELPRMALKYLRYPILVIVMLLCSFIIYRSLNTFSSTDPDSARYLLSSLVQSEAAIIAVVVSLSLVAAQLAASSYSARIMDIFRKYPSFWIIILVYIGAMIQGLRTLKLIEAQTRNTPTLEGEILFSYYFGILAFLALIPYIWNLLGLLRPSAVIDTISERITREVIWSFIISKKEEEDPVQPLIDIIRRSLDNHDYENVKNGLNAIVDRAVFVFEKNNLTEHEGSFISKYYVDHLTRFGKLAMNKQDEDSSAYLVNCMGKIGMLGANNGISPLVAHIINDINRIGDISVKHDLYSVSFETIYSLRNCGLEASKMKRHDHAITTIKYIEIIGKHALIKPTNITFTAIISIEDFTKSDKGVPIDIVNQAKSSMRSLKQLAETKAKEMPSNKNLKDIIDYFREKKIVV